MADNPFAAVLAEQLDQGSASQASLTILQEFCRGVTTSTGNRVECELERGYVVNYGQEWRPVIRAAHGGGRPQVLFRAYVPLDAWPVMLDLHETSLTRCNGPEELTAALTEFLRDPNVVAQIKYVMAVPTASPGNAVGTTTEP